LISPFEFIRTTGTTSPLSARLHLDPQSPEHSGNRPHTAAVQGE
jgi:hypothetical protein